MTKYSYTITSNKNTDCATMHEFVDAKDIVDAYGKVISVIAKLNKKNPDYIWMLNNIENAYFVGAEDDVEISE